MSQLLVEGLDVYYGAVHALKGVSLHVEAGEIVTLIGANGAGKTTLLRTISGLIAAKQGRVVFEGKDISKLPPDRKSTRLNSSHIQKSRMPSSA